MSGGQVRHPNSIANLRLGGFKKGYTPFNKGLRGKETHTWKGDQAGYVAIHIWIADLLGKPKLCTDCGDTSGSMRRYHWHNISGLYVRDVTDWVRLCAKCHKKRHKERET